MSKVETACPHCRKWNTVEKSSTSVTAFGYRIQCSHCSKYWEDTLGETGSLAKSAPADGMAAVRQRLIELGKVVDDYIARQAKFKPNGADQVQEATVLKFVAGMPEGMMLGSDIADAAEAAPTVRGRHQSGQQRFYGTSRAAEGARERQAGR